jgi:hypothetical protein
LSELEGGEEARSRRGFCLIFVVKSSEAVAGEWARARRICAGCVGVRE